MKKKLIVGGIFICCIVIIALVFFVKYNKKQTVINTKNVKSVDVIYMMNSVTLDDADAKELLKAIDKMKLKEEDRPMPKGWAYRVIITHDDGSTDEITLIEDGLYNCNRKLYSGSGLDVALLKRLSGLNIQK
jgi:hypothetical protein